MTVELKIPDLGDFDEVEVIEVLVAPGDKVAVEDPLVTLETDKASMDIPAEQAGSIVSVELKVGDLFLVHQMQLMQERLVFDTETYCDDKVIRHLKAD